MQRDKNVELEIKRILVQYRHDTERYDPVIVTNIRHYDFGYL